jgi:hypothetical protein
MNCLLLVMLWFATFLASLDWGPREALAPSALAPIATCQHSVHNLTPPLSDRRQSAILSESESEDDTGGLDGWSPELGSLSFHTPFLNGQTMALGERAGGLACLVGSLPLRC